LALCTDRSDKDEAINLPDSLGCDFYLSGAEELSISSISSFFSLSERASEMLLTKSRLIFFSPILYHHYCLILALFQLAALIHPPTRSP
jgi:hypothetical protein